MYCVYIGTDLDAPPITVWTRYPQDFITKEAAEYFLQGTGQRFGKVEIREEPPAPPPVSLNDEDLPSGPPS